MLVEAVADLVHRREDRGAVQVVLGVARREADVLGCERDAERMDGRVEPERPLVRAERACDDERQLVLRVGRVRTGEEVLELLRRALDGELTQRGAQPIEDAPHLARLHALLEVVEQEVVRVVRRREARDVLVLHLEGAVEPGPERLEVVVLACRHPCLDRLGRELRHLGAELGGDAACLLPVTRRHGDEAGVVRVGIEPGDVGGGAFEQLADLVANE